MAYSLALSVLEQDVKKLFATHSQACLGFLYPPVGLIAICCNTRILKVWHQKISGLHDFLGAIFITDNIALVVSGDQKWRPLNLAASMVAAILRYR
jgi:hypothetical protein